MIIDKIRSKREFKKLYKECGGQKKNRKLRHIFNAFEHNCAFCFYHSDRSLGGCIYIEEKEGRIFLSGFSRRKHFSENVEAVKSVCIWLKKDIYSQTIYKEAALVLKKAGFRHYLDDIYIRRYKIGQRQ